MNTDFGKIHGPCWVFGNDIDTDQIIQGQYLTLLSYEEMAKHTFEVLKPEFSKKVQKGDIVIAGRNFGGGSSREEAPMVLKETGVSCVVAESFARIFYRNAFNVGLPALIVPDITSKVLEGDMLDIDLRAGTVSIVRTSETVVGSVIPDRMIELLEIGGAIAWYKLQRQ